MPKTGLSATEIREKALEYTIAQMRAVGFEKVRLVDIAKALGVSHVALYKHFADKAALLDLVSERWLTLMDETLAAIVASPEHSLAKIETWFLTLHRMKCEKIQTDLALYKAFNAAAEVLKPFVQQHILTMQAQITTLVRQAMAEGQLPATLDPAAAARQLLEGTLGFHHPKLVVDNIAQERESALKALLTVLLHGLGARN